ncbi:unnamed protein product [Rotaria sordida]|uniref:Uncharacterized protein n=1 Tax=Rotaria sordida TaxID=392033 RepID=A0A814QW68_9BILA|nr:unnamed protein product [Rotaria sordida]CAF1555225.1 unnamed protein product [Rotaria sordida]CAF4034885.1 unnamed protein product [Rotaria sordida]CAF4257442.1 unnamed protein product [Rotaria sordida]
MSQTEAKLLHYPSGIYAEDLFLLKINQEYKQRDWNIGRGGRSTPKTLTMIEKYAVNYECKLLIDIYFYQLTNEEIFEIYTRICDDLSTGPYEIHPFSTGYVDFSRFDRKNFLKFNLIVNLNLLVNQDNHLLSKSQHRNKVKELLQ